MNKPKLERNIAVLLFILVLVIFSFAQRDTKKIEPLYNQQSTAHNELPAKNPQQTVTSADRLNN